MNIFTDFENYFDDEYTLSGENKLPSDNYVLDERFYIHGVAIKVDDWPTQWYTTEDAISHVMLHLNWSEATVIAHNCYFDGAILAYHFGIHPKQWGCTMCMGRGLFGPDVSNNLDSLSIRLGGKGKSDRVDFTKGREILTPAELERLGKYSVNDTDECARCFNEMIKTYPPSELDLIDLTLRMFLEPRLELDIPLLEQYNAEEMARKLTALRTVEWVYPYVQPEQFSLFEINKLEKIKDALMSDKQYEALLKKLNISVPLKKTGKTAFSKQDAQFKNMLKSTDERTKQLAQARLVVKSTMGETRSQTFLEVGDRPLPVQLLYFGSHSGRWSGKGGRNPQNLLKNSPLRRAIKAPKGYVLGKVDSSQVEARLTAFIASLLAGKESLLLRWFKEPKQPKTDVYCKFGTQFYGRIITTDDEFDRFVSKQAVLGLGFQMSAAKFQWQMKALADIDFDMPFCEEIVSFYRETFPEIPRMWWFMQDMLRLIMNGGYKDFGFFGFDKQGIRLPSGLHIHYNELQVYESNGRPQYSYLGRVHGKPKRVNLFGGKVTENLIQALDRQIVAEQMLIINERYKVVHNEHDGLIALLPEAEAEEGIKWMIEIMSTPPSWAKDFPVAAEGNISERYGE